MEPPRWRDILQDSYHLTGGNRMNTTDWTTILGPLQPLFNERSITEIMVDALDRIYVERKGTLEETGVTFDSPEALLAVIEAVCRLTSTALDPATISTTVRLPDGSRMTLIMPPTALNGPCFILHKVVTRELTWDMLVDQGAITREAVAVLQHAIHANISMLVVGSAGSGKTTVLNLLAASIPAAERILVVENRHELHFTHPRSIFLEAGSSAQASFSNVLQAAASMRPEWLVINELHGAEALTAMQILSVGHSGLVTLHASSPEDALNRLEAMCLMANLGLGLSEIRTSIASALQLIVVQQRLPDRRRRVIQIAELRGLEHDRFIIQPLLRYNPGTDRLESTGVKPSWETPELRG
jgi:pilus assembly protein CpaF